MIVTAFEVDGVGVRNGNFCIGSKLIYKGLQQDPWYHYFTLSGVPRFMYYFTDGRILSTTNGTIKRYGPVDVLKVPLSQTALFFEENDNEEIWRGFLSSNGVRWRTYQYDLTI